MSTFEKSRFEEIAEQDRLRWEAEMATYVPVKNAPVKKRKKKQLKLPGAPKKALSPFFFFSKEERPVLREKHPEWNVADIAKDLGKRWSVADEASKKRYEVMATEDKKRYAHELAIFRGTPLPPSPLPATAANTSQIPEAPSTDSGFISPEVTQE